MDGDVDTQDDCDELLDVLGQCDTVGQVDAVPLGLGDHVSVNVEESDVLVVNDVLPH